MTITSCSLFLVPYEKVDVASDLAVVQGLLDMICNCKLSTERLPSMKPLWFGLDIYSLIALAGYMLVASDTTDSQCTVSIGMHMFESAINICYPNM